MIVWRRDLYLGEGARDQKWKIIHNVRKHKLQLGAYVIVLSVNGKDTFDLIPTYMLSENSYKGRDIEVLGIALGKDEACELARQMIQDVFDRTGDVNIRGYFS